MKNVNIKKALVSVYNKECLDILAEYFLKNNIEVFTTGGTYKYFKKFNPKIKITEISELTNFKEILDGRVKSLHPFVHSGILAKKNEKSHISELKKLSIPFIDLVVVNLYPFENIINQKNVSYSKCIENIDIGGPTLIRAAAKNFESVTILSNPNQYKSFIDEILNNRNSVSLKFRRKCAQIAFENTSYYEAIISNWFNKDEKHFFNEKLSIPAKKIVDLRYGENPHQKAALFEIKPNNFQQISGKDISYNNINDLEVAVELSYQFSNPSCVILKHGNPCGVAIDKNQKTAYRKALSCDKTSAFGGIVAFNKKVSTETAKQINKIFTEIVVAPEFSDASLEVLSTKKNLILIRYKLLRKNNKFHYKSTNNFLLFQTKDNKIVSQKDIKIQSKKKPPLKILEDMIFGFTVSKYINSNAIVLVNNRSTLAIGGGQTSRLDSAEQAIRKIKKNFPKTRSVLASDGFFPFSDIVKLCSKNNIIGIIQPGGSKNDKEVIKVADKFGIYLVFTGIRHFKH